MDILWNSYEWEWRIDWRRIGWSVYCWINEFSKCRDIRLMEEKDVNDFMDWITICNVISLILWIDIQMIMLTNVFPIQVFSILMWIIWMCNESNDGMWIDWKQDRSRYINWSLQMSDVIEYIWWIWIFHWMWYWCIYWMSWLFQ